MFNNIIFGQAQMVIKYRSRIVKRSSIITSSLLSAYLKSNEVTNPFFKIKLIPIDTFPNLLMSCFFYSYKNFASFTHLTHDGASLHKLHIQVPMG